MTLLRLCLLPNFCKFNDDFYILPYGVPMGSPLAPLISEVFMRHFEEEVLQSENEVVGHVLYWYRYVDDVLCSWGGSLLQLQEFLSMLNDEFSSITFTLEVGGDKINFLDLTVSIGAGHPPIKFIN